MGQQPVARRAQGLGRPALARTMNRATRRALLELALQEMVSVVRASLDRNRTGDGHPGAVYQELAEALDRFDRLGGFEALRLDLWRDALGAVADAPPAAGSGAVRMRSDAQRSTSGAFARLVRARSGRDRTPSPPPEVPGE